MTKKFYRGRTETFRPVTNELIELLKIFSNGTSSAKQQRPALKKAYKAHRRRLNRAKEGFAVERHLFALYNIAKQQQQRVSGYKIPEIFYDTSYTRLKYDILSTSNCGGYALSQFGFRFITILTYQLWSCCERRLWNWIHY